MKTNRDEMEEMMVHVPFCTHKHINKVLVVGKINDAFKQELNKHECKDITYSDNLNIDDTFDIILYNKNVIDSLELASIQRCLDEERGIFVCISSFIYKDLEKAKKELEVVGKNFWICMPYSFGCNTLIFASKKYHPQADILLQVSDLLEDCQYYNTEIQNATFIYPTYINKAITGIAKR
ncbi:Spermidine synthase [hydrothermal vent metagenome]|uniref:Spermidine synthase n=1 Tax=hydrothermal vent metagenome TaxID=652676 RepID=A0A3B1E9A6_9ZZZZ